MRIEVLNGPNLDTLGRRDRALYGALTLPELETQIYKPAPSLDARFAVVRRTGRGSLIECHAALHGADGVVLNPGAWTHCSWAIRDAVELLPMPVVEVHLSNVDEREDWRRFSVLDGIVAARMVGLGPIGYCKALEALVRNPSDLSLRSEDRIGVHADGRRTVRL